MGADSDKEVAVEETVAEVAREVLEFASNRCDEEEQREDMRFALVTMALSTAAVAAAVATLTKEQYLEFVSDLWDEIDESQNHMMN